MESEGETADHPFEVLAVTDPVASLRNAIGLWAERNTRPESLPAQ